MKLPQVIMGREAFLKMLYWSEAVGDSEVGGLLEIKRNKNRIEITDTHLIEQTASIAEVILETKAIAKFMETRFDKLNTIKGWWHKHPSGMQSWSWHDDSTMKKLRKFFNGELLSLLYVPPTTHQKNYRFLARYELGKKNVLTFNTERITIDFEQCNKQKIKSQCIKDVKKLVKEPEPVSTEIAGYQRRLDDWWNARAKYIDGIKYVGYQEEDFCPRCGHLFLVSDYRCYHCGLKAKKRWDITRKRREANEELKRNKREIDDEMSEDNLRQYFEHNNL